MRRIAGSWIFLLILLLIDIYVFQALKSVAGSCPVPGSLCIQPIGQLVFYQSD